MIERSFPTYHRCWIGVAVLLFPTLAWAAGPVRRSATTRPAPVRRAGPRRLRTTGGRPIRTRATNGISRRLVAVAALPARNTAVVAAPLAGDQRPFTMKFNLPGGKLNGIWHFRGTPGYVISRDTVFTMKEFDYDDQAQVGIATGNPKVDDTHNVLTADKITIIDSGTVQQKRAICEGHVRILHHPDDADKTGRTGDHIGDVMAHDVVLTCDQATYYYRTKIGFCTGHILMTGQDTENNKPVTVTMTTTRLELEQKNNVYRAIGSVVIHDGTRTITTPKLTAVSVQSEGKRKLQSIEMEPPIEASFMIDEKDDGTTGTGTGATPATGGAPSGTPTGGGPAAPAPSAPTVPAKPNPGPPSGPGGSANPTPAPQSTPTVPNPAVPVPNPTLPAPNPPVPAPVAPKTSP